MTRHRYVRTELLLTALGLFFATQASADTVYTRDHRIWRGLVVAENANQVWLDMGFDIAIFPREKIVAIRRSDSQTTRYIRRNLIQARQRRDSLLKRRESLPQEAVLIPMAGHMLVDTVLNGTVKARLLVDTGSTFTFLSPTIAQQLGILDQNTGRTAQVLMSDGRKETMMVTSLESVKVGTAEAHGVQVAVLPGSSEKNSLSDGLLGVSFLSRFNFKIDYQKNKLILERNGSDGLPKNYTLPDYLKK